ncbi:hypothetical protein J6590_040341 [Homalodisca vitripennis]|nr:hypothetical protein J6590_040341 [Homalodisca vitripennis]
MSLTLLLVVATYVIEGLLWRASAVPFIFRENCELKHLHNTYSASCNGGRAKEKNLVFTGNHTLYMTEINMTNFQSVKFDSSVNLTRIIVSKTSRVSLFLSNPHLTDLQIDNVDELTLEYKHRRVPLEVPYIKNMTLKNINTLRLISDIQEFVWPISTINLINILDMDLGSSLLKMFAEHVVITKTKDQSCEEGLKKLDELLLMGSNRKSSICTKNVRKQKISVKKQKCKGHIRLHNKTSLVLSASSIAIENSFLYIHENGFLNVTANQTIVRDSHVNLEDGYLNLVDAREVLFKKNSLHGFNNRPLLVHDNITVRFEENDIFTHDIGGVLSLSKWKVIFKGNNFGCDNCPDNRRLLDSDLQDSGYVNYCYTNCNVTLNAFKKYLADSCFCLEGVQQVADLERLCSSNTTMKCPKVLKDLPLWFQRGKRLIWWFLIVLIPLLLIASLVFWVSCIWCKKKPKCEQPQQTTAFNNACYDKCLYEHHHYEEVEPATANKL